MVVVRHPENIGQAPQVFQSYQVHACPILRVVLGEKHLISGVLACLKVHVYTCTTLLTVYLRVHVHIYVIHVHVSCAISTCTCTCTYRAFRLFTCYQVHAPPHALKKVHVCVCCPMSGEPSCLLGNFNLFIYASGCKWLPRR